MTLFVTRKPFETWREAVARYAGDLSDECLETFDSMVADGYQEPAAAFDALYEWDCLLYEGKEVY